MTTTLIERPQAGACARRGEGPSIRAFEEGDIDPAEFDHEAHVYVAWSYLQGYGLLDSIIRFSGALRRLTTKLGVESKYHETITWFFMMVIAERRTGDARDDWRIFKAENADLFNDAGGLLGRYYSKARLDSEAARSRFLLPDPAR